MIQDVVPGSWFSAMTHAAWMPSGPGWVEVAVVPGSVGGLSGKEVAWAFAPPGGCPVEGCPGEGRPVEGGTVEGGRADPDEVPCTTAAVTRPMTTTVATITETASHRWPSGDRGGGDAVPRSTTGLLRRATPERGTPGHADPESSAHPPDSTITGTDPVSGEM